MRERIRQAQLSMKADPSSASADKTPLYMQVNIAEVNEELQSLKPANTGAPDPVSKLWPNHYSAAVQKRNEEGCTPLSEAEQGAGKGSASKTTDSEALKKRFPQYYSQYGYE